MQRSRDHLARHASAARRIRRLEDDADAVVVGRKAREAGVGKGLHRGAPERDLCSNRAADFLTASKKVSLDRSQAQVLTSRAQVLALGSVESSTVPLQRPCAVWGLAKRIRPPLTRSNEAWQWPLI